MATVRKIKTKARKDGTRLERWRLTYSDAHGDQHRLSFPTKAAADARRIEIEGQIAAGTHVADRASMTVLQALRGTWLRGLEALVRVGERERQTLRPYRNHVELHIAKHAIAHKKLSRLTTPDCQAFADWLDQTRTRAMRKRVMKSLRMGLGACVRAGLVGANPAAEARTARVSGRHRTPVEIPPKDALRRMLEAALILDQLGITPWAHAMLVTLLFPGLRMSELRALARPRVTLTKAGGKIEITERADERGRIGPPKSAAGRRTIPIGPVTGTTLRDHVALQARRQAEAIAAREADRPRGAVGPTQRALPAFNPRRLLFCNGAGGVEAYENIYHRVFMPVMVFAGLTVFEVRWRVDDDQPRRARFAELEAAQAERDRLLAIDAAAARAGRAEHVASEALVDEVALFGMHALRHAAASAWIEQGIKPKKLQALIGHEDLTTTMNIYGHLWPDDDADAEAAAASERSILGS